MGHTGLWRMVHPVKDQLGKVERALSNPGMGRHSLDNSRDDVTEFPVASLDAARVEVRGWEKVHVM